MKVSATVSGIRTLSVIRPSVKGFPSGVAGTSCKVLAFFLLTRECEKSHNPKKPKIMLLYLKERPLCVNCDWLSFSMKIDPKADVVAPAGMRFELLPGTNIFKKRWILYDISGSKVMTFCCDPYSSVLRDDVATCQVSNPYLYEPNPEWLEGLLYSFKRGTFHGMSRWDVCCDFCPTDGEFKTIRKLTSGSQYVSGKSEGSLFWHTEKYDDKEYRMAHCMSWGAAASQLKIKLYNKSLEINAKNPILCSKPYILSEWKEHLPNTDNVWRLEFSVTDVNQMAIGDKRIDMKDALSWNYLARFYAEVKAKRFIVRMNQGRRKGHKNEDEVVPFLPFEMEGISIRKANAMSEREPLDELRALARHLWMHIVDKSVLMDDNRYNSIRSLLCDLAENPNVCSYLDSLCDGSFLGWMMNVDGNRGAGVYEINF